MTRNKKKAPVGRRLEPLPEFIRARLQNSISFYFSNIHEDAKTNEMWKAFGGCGKVKDVFIPSKRNKEGSILGL